MGISGAHRCRSGAVLVRIIAVLVPIFALSGKAILTGFPA